MTFTPQDRFYINDIETLMVLADARCMVILETLGQKPRTPADLAAITRLTPDVLSKALDVLEDYGLIQIIEDADNERDRLYAASAVRYVIDEDLQPLATAEATDAALALAFATIDRVKSELLHNPASLFSTEQDEKRAEFGKGRLHLTRSEAVELAQELNEIWERYRKEEPGPNTEPYSLFLSFFATPNPIMPDSEEDDL